MLPEIFHVVFHKWVDIDEESIVAEIAPLLWNGEVLALRISEVWLFWLILRVNFDYLRVHRQEPVPLECLSWRSTTWGIADEWTQARLGHRRRLNLVWAALMSEVARMVVSEILGTWRRGTSSCILSLTLSRLSKFASLGKKLRAKITDQLMVQALEQLLSHFWRLPLEEIVNSPDLVLICHWQTWFHFNFLDLLVRLFDGLDLWFEERVSKDGINSVEGTFYLGGFFGCSFRSLIDVNLLLVVLLFGGIFCFSSNNFECSLELVISLQPSHLNHLLGIYALILELNLRVWIDKYFINQAWLEFNFSGWLF